MDFYSDELTPLLSLITEIDLENQGIHDNSGILDILSQNIILVKLSLAHNAISINGLKKFTAANRVYSEKLGKLTSLNLHDNPIINFSIRIFSNLKNLTEIFISDEITFSRNDKIKKCEKSNMHEPVSISSSFPIIGCEQLLIQMLNGSENLPYKQKPICKDQVQIKLRIYCSDPNHHQIESGITTQMKRIRNESKRISRPQKRLKTEKRKVFEM
jgi:hypothetical protein